MVIIRFSLADSKELHNSTNNDKSCLIQDELELGLETKSGTEAGSRYSLLAEADANTEAQQVLRLAQAELDGLQIEAILSEKEDERLKLSVRIHRDYEYEKEYLKIGER